MNNTDLEIVNQYKTLVIILDHILKIFTMMIVSYKIYLQFKVRHYLDYNASILLYETMILPYFDYGDIHFHEYQPCLTW